VGKGERGVCNDVSLSRFVLPYFVLRGPAFVHPLPADPVPDWIRLPATPRRFTTRNAGFHCTEIGDVRGLGVTTSAAIPVSYAPTFRPFLAPAPPPPPLPITGAYPIRSFLGLTHGPVFVVL